MREVAFLNRDRLAGTCIVSIGSGVSREQLLSEAQLRGKGTGFHNFKDIFRILRAAATKTELTDTDVHFQASQDLGFVYFRFNPTHDRNISLDEWDKSGRTKSEIEHSTERYLETEETKTALHRCASAIVSKMAGSVHFGAGNVHYFVPRAVNSLFTGRTGLLHHIKQCLTSRENDQVGLHRIFVITGMGGQGKSEICLKLAHDTREEFVINLSLNLSSSLSHLTTGTDFGASSGLTLPRAPPLKATSSPLRTSLDPVSKIFKMPSEYLLILKRDGFLS